MSRTGIQTRCFDLPSVWFSKEGCYWCFLKARARPGNRQSPAGAAAVAKTRPRSVANTILLTTNSAYLSKAGRCCVCLSVDLPCLPRPLIQAGKMP